MNVDEAIKIAKKECKDPYAQAYLEAIPQVIELVNESAVRALKIQLLYALNNMRYWRSKNAREAKKVMNKFAISKE